MAALGLRNNQGTVKLIQPNLRYKLPSKAINNADLFWQVVPVNMRNAIRFCATVVTLMNAGCEDNTYKDSLSIYEGHLPFDGKQNGNAEVAPPERLPAIDVSRVGKVIAKELGVELEKLVPSARLVADLGADSLDLVQIQLALEMEFGVEISDDMASMIVTVRDAVLAVQTAQRALPKTEPE
jgi:acyl carrier protein